MESPATVKKIRRPEAISALPAGGRKKNRSRLPGSVLVRLVFFCLAWPAQGPALTAQPVPGAPASSPLPYPEIRSLLPQDRILKQLQEDIVLFNIQEKAGKQLPPLGIYVYRVRETDDFFALAARFNLPQETLATINRLASPAELEAGRLLLVPNSPGLFFPANPENELEKFMQSWRNPAEDQGLALTVSGSRGNERFLYIPGLRFNSLERAYFLGILFRNPLPDSRISSWFGRRISPISGEQHFHNGIDMAAPEGTAVYAARGGAVADTGWNPVFGNYIKISHPGGYETTYGHLKKIFVELNQIITSSIIIGEVGSTGMSTGPHLHFELRKDAQPVDPASLIPGVN